MNIIPTIIDSTSTHEFSVDLYSKMLNERIIFLNGEINMVAANLVISELLYLDSISHEDISLYINSGGGEVISGLAIYDTMNFIQSDVITIVIGEAASMAAVLLSSGAENKRYALANSEIMIHQILGGISGQASDILIQTKRIKRLKDRINHILAKNCHKTIKDIEKDTDRDNYLSPNDALKYGIIDKII